MQDINILEAISDPINIHLAWRKFKKYVRYESVWFDELECANFELDLENQIASLSNDILNISYFSEPLIPIIHPKQHSSDGKTQVRQLFKVSIRDQVAWLAYINVIGKWLDNQMPNWSFGQRLYRPSWFEQIGQKQELMIGPYRNTSGYVYRKIQS